MDISSIVSIGALGRQETQGVELVAALYSVSGLFSGGGLLPSLLQASTQQGSFKLSLQVFPVYDKTRRPSFFRRHLLANLMKTASVGTINQEQPPNLSDCNTQVATARKCEDFVPDVGCLPCVALIHEIEQPTLIMPQTRTKNTHIQDVIHGISIISVYVANNDLRCRRLPAHLYNRDGEVEKCIESCPETIKTSEVFVYSSNIYTR